jgi:CPA1 family monovalent cation:H+ antiporter
MDHFLAAEAVVIELILVVSLVAMAVRSLRVPYEVALVVVGLLIAATRPVHIGLTPELILGVLVPPLVFEAAFQLNFRQVRRCLPAILTLAVPGVVLTTLIVGILIPLVTPLPAAAAFVFGAAIAATDPVAVVALFRRLGVPVRLNVLIEGESLLNDGTAIVVFNLMLVVALSGRLDAPQAIGNFVVVSVGGSLVGLAMGWLISRLIATVDDYLIEITLTTVLAFGSYLVAEQLHVSGVLAVVAAGLVNGNLGPRGMSPTTRIVLFNFWEYVAFLANSLIFLLIGTQMNLAQLGAAWQPIGWAVLAVLAARAVVVYGLQWVMGRTCEPLPASWLHVLAWGGLRGAISLALVLSLPVTLGTDRALIQVMAFGVALFSLLVQGTTMNWLLQRLHVVARSEVQADYERRHARLIAVRAASEHLDRLHRQGLLSTQAWEALRPDLDRRVAAMADAVHQVLQAAPDLQAKELDTARRELLRAQRSALAGLRRDGVIGDEIYDELAQEIDAVLMGERLSNEPALAGTGAEGEELEGDNASAPPGSGDDDPA